MEVVCGEVCVVPPGGRRRRHLRCTSNFLKKRRKSGLEGKPHAPPPSRLAVVLTMTYGHAPPRHQFPI